MKYQKMDLKTAFSYVYNKRKTNIPINTSFFEQLISYEKKLFAKNSVKMIEVKGQKGLTPDFLPKDFPQLLTKEVSMKEESEASISIVSLASDV